MNKPTSIKNIMISRIIPDLKKPLYFKYKNIDKDTCSVNTEKYYEEC